jgi:hypothetical protein
MICEEIHAFIPLTYRPEVFMKGTTIVVLPTLWLALVPAFLFGQVADLSGTWTGEAVLPGATEKIPYTLKLQKSGDSYTGTLAATKSAAEAAALTDVRLESNVLRCKVTISSGGRELKLRVALNSFYGRLVGGWVTDEGAHAFAPLDFERSK